MAAIKAKLASANAISQVQVTAENVFFLVADHHAHSHAHRHGHHHHAH